jgi:hypothetical protein
MMEKHNLMGVMEYPLAIPWPIAPDRSRIWPKAWSSSTGESQGRCEFTESAVSFPDVPGLGRVMAAGGNDEANQDGPVRRIEKVRKRLKRMYPYSFQPSSSPACYR